MTLEELQAAETAILKQMSQPQDMRGPGGIGATNRSLADLQSALSAIRAEIAKASGTTPQRVSYVSFSKG